MRSRLSFQKRSSLEPAERATLLLLSASLFLVIGSTAVIGRTVSRALFLNGLSPEYIPARYFAVTAGVILSSLLFSRIAGRFRSPRLIVLSTSTMLAGLVVYRFLLGTRAAGSLWLLGSFYTFLEIVMALSIVQFWTFASEIVNTRQARRIFPVVNGAGNLGSLVAGAAITALLPLLGTLDLLYVIIAMLAGYLFLVVRLERRHAGVYAGGSAPVSAAKKPGATLQSSLALLRGSPLLVTMALIVVLITLAVNIVDYQFDLSLKTAFAASPEDLPAFLGSFYFWTGVVGLVLQLLLSGPLLRRFGVHAVLLVMPLGILAGSAGVLASGAALWAVTLARSSDTVFRYTLHDTAFNLLYVPLGQRVRSQARVLIDGILKPLSIGLAGFLFYLVSRLAGIAVIPWSYAAIVVVALMLASLLRLRREYLATLQESIQRRYFDPAGEALDLANLQTVETIKETLRRPEEIHILHALALTEEIPEVDWTDAWLPLLDDGSPSVRRQALRMLRSTQAPEHAEIVRRCFDDPDVLVRASAMATYWALRGDEALAEMQPFMQHPEPKLQSAAVSGALRFGGEEARRIARPVFESMVGHPDAAVRISAAYALGEIHSEDGVRLLRLLLTDPDPQVRLQAVHSAGQLADMAVLPEVIDQLGDVTGAAAAGTALVRYGASAMPYLRARFADRSTVFGVRHKIPQLVALIPGRGSIDFLLANMDDPDEFARARVYLALGRLCQSGEPLNEIDRAAIHQRYEAEIRLAYLWSVKAANPRLKSEEDLLKDTYTWRRRYALDRLIYLTAILHPNAKLAEVRANLFGADQQLRAIAIELIESLVPGRFKDLVLPLIEGSPERMLATAEKTFFFRPPDMQSELTEAVESNDAWLAACALFRLVRSQQDGFSALIHQGLRSPVGLVRETAVQAAARQFTPQEFQWVLRHHGGPGSAPKAPAMQIDFPMGEEDQRGDRMPISTMERILLLGGVELFREIPVQDLEWIARLCSLRHFAPGERFIEQGDVSDGLYILVEGEVEISSLEQGVIGVSRKGEVIGEIGVLANHARAASCTALSETTALHIEQTDFWDLLEHNTTFALAVIRVLVPKLLSYSGIDH